MTLSSKLGLKTNRPVVSLQQSESGTQWTLTFSSGTANVEIHTESDVETGSFEGSSISEKGYGYKATVKTAGPPKKLNSTMTYLFSVVSEGQLLRTIRSVISTLKTEKFTRVKSSLMSVHYYQNFQKFQLFLKPLGKPKKFSPVGDEDGKEKACPLPSSTFGITTSKTCGHQF